MVRNNFVTCFYMYLYNCYLKRTVSSTQAQQQTKAPRWASFVPGQPRLVMVLAYQRSGSTYFGELFNKDVRAFYLFEPLDGLYSSIYGTLPGWNIPSDIYTYVNGSERYVVWLCVNIIRPISNQSSH